MITGIHFLLSYMCNSECDHCFVFSSPRAKGTFTPSQLEAVFNEIDKIRSVNTVYFEGGEPFLFYLLMLKGIKLARDRSLSVGIVTNAYWATSEEMAELYLEPLANLGIDNLSLSDDDFHAEGTDALIYNASAAARKLDIPTDTICIEKPTAISQEVNKREKGEPIIGGGVRFRGRAVDNLLENLPRRPWTEFTECPFEDLANPKRLHVDAYGNVHLCQGLLMGNMWQTPLSRLIYNYGGESHPIAGPIIRGGLVELVKKYNFEPKEGYVDACHLCYMCRRALLEKFPLYLGPKCVYGFEKD